MGLGNQGEFHQISCNQQKTISEVTNSHQKCKLYTKLLYGENVALNECFVTSGYHFVFQTRNKLAVLKKSVSTIFHDNNIGVMPRACNETFDTS